MNASSVGEKPDTLRHGLVATIGVSAFFEFFVNHWTLPLWFEVPLQVVLLLMVGVSVVADQDPEQRPAKVFADGFLGLVGILIVVLSLYRVIKEPSDFFSWDTCRALVLPIWLTLVSVPFVYCLGVFAQWEDVVKVVPPRDVGRNRRWVQLAFRLNIRASLVARFKMQWKQPYFNAASNREARAVLSAFVLTASSNHHTPLHLARRRLRRYKRRHPTRRIHGLHTELPANWITIAREKRGDWELNLITIALEYYSAVSGEAFELRKRHSHIGSGRADRSTEAEVLDGICERIAQAESRVADVFNSGFETAIGHPGKPGKIRTIINWTFKVADAMAEWHLLREQASDLGVSFDAFDARNMLTQIAEHFVEQGSSIVSRLRAETNRLNLEASGSEREVVVTIAVEAPERLLQGFYDELARLRSAA